MHRCPVSLPAGGHSKEAVQGRTRIGLQQYLPQIASFELHGGIMTKETILQLALIATDKTMNL